MHKILMKYSQLKIKYSQLKQCQNTKANGPVNNYSV